MGVQVLTDDVLNTLKEQGVVRVDYIGPTKAQRCARDDVPLERFVGLKDGWQYIAHVCPSCGKASVWNLDVAEPAEHFEIGEKGGLNVV